MKAIYDHPLPHFNERPAEMPVDTIIIHSLYAENCTDQHDTAACIAALDLHKVASHYLISRNGDLVCLVNEQQRAWHAGESRMPFEDDAREVVNDFSIGIELVAGQDSSFSEEQYSELTSLIVDILARHKIRYILGHEHIAPGRKSDPGRLFDWAKLKKMLGEAGVDTGGVRFFC